MSEVDHQGNLCDEEGYGMVPIKTTKENKPKTKCPEGITTGCATSYVCLSCIHPLE